MKSTAESANSTDDCNHQHFRERNGNRNNDDHGPNYEASCSEENLAALIQAQRDIIISRYQQLHSSDVAVSDDFPMSPEHILALFEAAEINYVPNRDLPEVVEGGGAPMPEEYAVSKTDGNKDRKEKKRPEVIDDNEAPMPEDFIDAEDGNEGEKKLRGDASPLAQASHGAHVRRPPKPRMDPSQLIEVVDVLSSIHSDSEHSENEVQTSSVAPDLEAPSASPAPQFDYEASARLVQGSVGQFHPDDGRDLVSMRSPVFDAIPVQEESQALENNQLIQDSNQVPGGQTPVCDAIPISNQPSDEPWWKRRSVICLSLIVVAVSLVVGALVATVGLLVSQQKGSNDSDSSLVSTHGRQSTTTLAPATVTSTNSPTSTALPSPTTIAAIHSIATEATTATNTTNATIANASIAATPKTAFIKPASTLKTTPTSTATITNTLSTTTTTTTTPSTTTSSTTTTTPTSTTPTSASTTTTSTTTTTPTTKTTTDPTTTTTTSELTATSTTSSSTSTSSTTTTITPTTTTTTTTRKCVRFLQKLFQKNCNGCWPTFAIDGDTAVAEDGKSIQFFSINKDNFDVETTIPIDYEVYEISLFGDVAVVGAPVEDGNTGAVYVYERSQVGEWKQTMQIVPDDIVGQVAWFGSSASLSGDVFVVGAFGIEAAFIYRRSGSAWELETKLVPEGATLVSYGVSVSIVGNVVAVGDNLGNRVFVFHFDSSSNSSKQLGGRIVNDDCSWWFGTEVVLTSDNGLLIGCRDESTLDGAGAVYYYKRSEGDGEFVFRQKIMASDAAHWDYFGGGSNQIAVNGDVMVVGTQIETNGKAYVFTKVGNVWNEVSIISAPDGSGLYFGHEVAVSQNKVLVRSETNVYTYVFDIEYC